MTYGCLTACNVHHFHIICVYRQTDDTSIQQRVNDELKKDRAGAALNATVDNGVVTVTGECMGDNCAQDLADKIKKMDGVKDVQMNVIAKPQ